MKQRRHPAPQAQASTEAEAPAAAEEVTEEVESTEPVVVPVIEAEAPAAAEASPIAPVGMVRCRAIQTCGCRGMPKFAGEEFWLERDGAERIAAKGHLEIL
jgi:hypothetical protein